MTKHEVFVSAQLHSFFDDVLGLSEASSKAATTAVLGNPAYLESVVMQGKLALQAAKAQGWTCPKKEEEALDTLYPGWRLW